MRLIYIAGAGRSGSTLLARILGQLDGFVSVGEVRHLWRTGAPLLASDQLCGCGRSYESCPLWGAVIPDVLGRLSTEGLDELQALFRSVDRIRYIPWMRGVLPPKGYRERLQTYSSLLSELYQSILNHAGADILVDASKDPSTLYLLGTDED